MSNQAQKESFGYRCPVRNCDKRNNRRFSPLGLAQHIVSYHGEEEFASRMRAVKINK